MTRGSRHDSPLLRRLLRRAGKRRGDPYADSALRENCRLAAARGRSPIVKPEKSPTRRKRGCRP
ncbi:MAG: hypothetical protein QW587_03750 [Candidatus Bathyarchaeia archaeon]